MSKIHMLPMASLTLKLGTLNLKRLLSVLRGDLRVAIAYGRRQQK